MCLLSFNSNCLGIIVFIFSFIKISSAVVSDSFSYTQNEPCKFTLNNGEVIDLSSFLKSEQPLIASTNASCYIYHPCVDIPLRAVIDNECQKGYGLCYFVPLKPGNSPVDYDKALLNLTQGTFSLLALNDELIIRENRMNKPEIVYKHRNKESSIINTSIQLECDEKVENFVLSIGKTSKFEHILMLTSRHNCLKTPHYMSGGTVFFLIMIVFIIIYFLGGFLVLRFIRGATGIEMIPNHEFWCSLPQMAKNGFTYLASCGKSTPDSYEKI